MKCKHCCLSNGLYWNILLPSQISPMSAANRHTDMIRSHARSTFNSQGKHKVVNVVDYSFKKCFHVTHCRHTTNNAWFEVMRSTSKSKLYTNEKTTKIKFSFCADIFSKYIFSADWFFRRYNILIFIQNYNHILFSEMTCVVDSSVLQEKNQVGDGGSQKSCDQFPIHLGRFNNDADQL